MLDFFPEQLTISDTKILIIDDQQSSCELISSVLEKDYRIYTANSGAEAINLSEEVIPDLILLDIKVQGMGGVELGRAFKKNKKITNIPIIFITDSVQQSDEDQYWEAGAADLIHKPLNACTLKNRVKTHLTLKRKVDFFRHLAFVDELTDLYNRRYFDDFYRRQIKYSKRSKAIFGLLMIDIDRFKQYNDYYGHIQGDECLKKIAKALTSVVNRPFDLVARYGGEEFVIILSDIDHSGLEYIANQFIVAINDLSIPHLASEFGKVTVSVGGSIFNSSIRHVQNLLKEADDALYLAKKAGRNRFHFHEQKNMSLITSSSEYRASLAKGLAPLGAIENNQFELRV